MSASYLPDALWTLRYYKQLTERAMAQVNDGDLTVALDEESNSIALIVKHMVGNMRSRWTDFLTTDGEKPDRNRDSEFVEPSPDRQSLMALWEQGWSLVFASIEPLETEDLSRTVTIRGEPHSVLQAINRQVAHYVYHCGQIVFLAKHLSHQHWHSLTLPRKRP